MKKENKRLTDSELLAELDVELAELADEARRRGIDPMGQHGWCGTHSEEIGPVERRTGWISHLKILLGQK